MYHKNLFYKSHHIPKLKCFFPRYAVVFTKSPEAKCYDENQYVFGAASAGYIFEILIFEKIPRYIGNWPYIDLFLYDFIIL